MSGPASVPYAFPDVPGLMLEPMSEAHLDEAAQLLVAARPNWRCTGGCWVGSGSPDMCSAGPTGHARDALAQRLVAADTWALALTFAGRPLQVELLRLDDAAEAVTIDLTLRATRERPSWFWREALRPLVEACAALGRTRFDVWSGMEPGARAWRTFYAEQVGARQTVDSSDGRRIGFFRSGGTRWTWPVDLSPFTGWPARRTVGFDQVDGRVRVWEATEAELPAVRQLIADQVPIARRAIALRMVDEWWHLDRATLLLGARDGELRYARAIRPRKGAVAGFSILSGVFDEPEQRQMGQAVLAWCKAAGYETVTGFIPTATWTHAGVQHLMAASPHRVVAEHRHFREPFTEIEIPVP